MRKLFSILFTVLIFSLNMHSIAGSQIYKCTTNGSIQYQQNPCANEKNITISTKSTDKKTAIQTTQSGRPSQNTANSDKPTSNLAQQTSFKCDNRKYCTQMKSCSEAKFFLANCPGVKMDGDGDRIPCEEQHCGH